MVLEIQQHQTSFLLSCCKAVLHDFPISTLLPMENCKLGTLDLGKCDFPSVAGLTLEAPYRVPQKPDLDRLCVLISAKLSDVEDHLWSLREDPGYFTACLLEWKEHVGEHVKFIESECFDGHRLKDFWAYIINMMLSSVFGTRLTCKEMERRARNLSGLVKKHNKTEGLHVNVKDALEQFKDFLTHVKEPFLDALFTGVRESPPMHHCYDWSDNDGHETDFDRMVALRHPKCRTQAQWRVHYAFDTLCDEELEQMHGLQSIAEEI